MEKNYKRKNEARTANQEMSNIFKGFGGKTSSLANSEAEVANQKIQVQFYENEEDNNFLPFHIDINNPPIKK